MVHTSQRLPGGRRSTQNTPRTPGRQDAAAFFRDKLERGTGQEWENVTHTVRVQGESQELLDRKEEFLHELGLNRSRRVSIPEDHDEEWLPQEMQEGRSRVEEEEEEVQDAGVEEQGLVEVLQEHLIPEEREARETARWWADFTGESFSPSPSSSLPLPHPGDSMSQQRQ